MSSSVTSEPHLAVDAEEIPQQRFSDGSSALRTTGPFSATLRGPSFLTPPGIMKNSLHSYSLVHFSMALVLKKGRHKSVQLGFLEMEFHYAQLLE